MPHQLQTATWAPSLQGMPPGRFSRVYKPEDVPTSSTLCCLELQLQSVCAAGCLCFPCGQRVALLLSLRQPALQGRPLSIPGLPGINELGGQLGSPLLCFLPTQQQDSAYYWKAAPWQEHTFI